jgi:NADH-ubiquinone oxidoreductase chain 2
MAGIPPLLGFFSKQFVLYSAIQSGYYFMSIICIITSVISASYYLKIIRILHSPSPAGSVREDVGIVNSNNPLPFLKEGENEILSNSHSFLISTLTLAILFFVLKPSILLNSTKLLSLSLFYY